MAPATLWVIERHETQRWPKRQQQSADKPDIRVGVVDGTKKRGPKWGLSFCPLGRSGLSHNMRSHHDHNFVAVFRHVHGSEQ